jgi:hypothetical protein
MRQFKAHNKEECGLRGWGHQHYWQPNSHGASILVSSLVDVFHDQSSEPGKL